MNVEQVLIRTDNIKAVIECIRSRINSSTDTRNSTRSGVDIVLMGRYAKNQQLANKRQAIKRL